MKKLLTICAACVSLNTVAMEADNVQTPLEVCQNYDQAYTATVMEANHLYQGADALLKEGNDASLALLLINVADSYIELSEAIGLRYHDNNCNEVLYLEGVLYD